MFKKRNKKIEKTNYIVNENDNIKIEYLLDIPNMSVGSPSPQLIANGRTYIAFFSETHKDNDDVTEDIILIEFKGIIYHKFGVPNDEAIIGHPLYKLGLERYQYHRIINSPLIDELERMNRVHPYHSPDFYNRKKHYIITFHDETFECIAESYVVKVYKNYGNMKQVLINEISSSDIEMGLFD